MATNLWSIMVGQLGIPELAPLEAIINFIGLVVTFYLIYAYFKNNRNAKFWVSKTAFACYALSITSAVAPLNLEPYTQALGAFGSVFVAVMDILLKLAGTAFIQPIVLSGMIVIGIELFDDIITMIRTGKFGEEFLKLD